MKNIQRREIAPRRLRAFAGAAAVGAGLMIASPAMGQNCPASVVFSKAGRSAATRFEKTILAQDHSKVRRELGTTTDSPVEARTTIEISKEGRARVSGLTFSCGREGRACPEEIDLDSWNDDDVSRLRFPMETAQVAGGSCLIQMSAYVPVVPDLGAPKTRPIQKRTPAPEKIAPPRQEEKSGVSSKAEPRTAEEAEMDVPQLSQFRLDRDGFISHVPTKEQRARLSELKRDPDAPRKCTASDMEKSGFTWMSWSIYKNKVRPAIGRLKKALGQRLEAIRFRANVQKGGALELIGADGVCGGKICETGRDPLLASGASADDFTLSYSGGSCTLHFDAPLDESLTYRDFRDERMLR